MKSQVLLFGAFLTLGQRIVAAALRVMGCGDRRDYARYHEVVNRAVWSPRQPARILLVLLLQHHSVSQVRTVARRSEPSSTSSNGLGQRPNGLVRRLHPHSGAHLPDGRLVPLGQASRSHSLGVDPRPSGGLRSLETGPESPGWGEGIRQVAREIVVDAVCIRGATCVKCARCRMVQWVPWWTNLRRHVICPKFAQRAGCPDGR